MQDAASLLEGLGVSALAHSLAIQNGESCRKNWAL